MYKIIGGDGREYGPVSSGQIAQWIAQNRANAQTMAKPEGAADWLPLSQQPEFAAAFATRHAPPPIPGAEIPDLPGTTATGPVYTATPSPAPQIPVDRAAAAHACAGRPYRLSVMDTLTRGWEIVTANFWLTVGATFVAIIANGVAANVPFASLFLSQVFMAGIFWLLLRVSRREPAEFPDVFAGFTRHFSQLVLLSLVMSGCLIVLLLLGAGPLLWALFRSGVFSGGRPDFTQMIGPLLLLPALMIPMIYFSIAWIFAPLLVIDRGLGFWEAMELSRKVAGRRWFKLFFLHLAFIPLVIAGLLCFLVGIFVVYTLLFASYAAAYETAFADQPEKPAADNHPNSLDRRG